MRRKIFSILLSVAMVMVMMPSMAFATQTASPWDGTSVEKSWYTGHESESSYTILSAEDLAGFAQLVNDGTSFEGKTITLGVDIDLNNKNWTPIGESGNAFSGTFNGNNKTVSNVKIDTKTEDYYGFFGYLNGATVQNLNLEVNVTGSAAWVGGLAGRVDSCTVRDCNVGGSINITGTGSYEAGNHGIAASGIVEYAYLSRLSGCTSNVAITTSSTKEIMYAGGIACEVNGSTISNCTNTGNISAVSPADAGYAYAGGIATYVKNGSTVTDCNNTGNISAGDANSCYAVAGGILGQIWVEAEGTITVTGCINTGAITARGKTATTENDETYDKWNCVGNSIGEVYNYFDENTVINTLALDIAISDIGWIQKLNDAEYVNEDGTHGYGTFNDALQKVSNGKTVTLLKNISYKNNGVGQINITKSITIDGNDYSISGYGNRSNNKTTMAINNNGSGMIDVTLKNLTINNDGASGRAVETRGRINSLKIENCVLNCTGTGNTQVLTIGGNQSSLASISIDKSELSAGTSGYPIIAFNPIELQITNNSLFSGYCGIYFKGVSGSEGSHGSVVDALNSAFDCPNVHNGNSNDFGVFTLEDENVSITLTNCFINAEAQGMAAQAVLMASSYAVRASEYSIGITGNSVVNGILLESGGNWTNGKYVITGGTFSSDPTAYVPVTNEAVKDSVTNTWSVAYKSADYSKVDEAIAKVNALNKNDYKDFTAVEAAIRAVVRDKNITEQDAVDAMAKAIEDAINALEKKPVTAPITPSDNVTNSGTTGSDNAQTNADMSDKVTVSEGTASTVVDQTTADKIVDKAVANESKEVVIDATTSSSTTSNTVSSAQVGIPTATLEAIAEKTDADVTVKTDVAEVKMDNTTAAAVAEQATGDTVQIIAEKVKEDQQEIQFELKVVCSNGTVISDFKGGNVSVTVPLTKNMADKKLVCVYIDDNGIYHKVDGSINEEGTHYTFTTGHFSTYAIMSEEEADAIISKQTAEEQLAKIKKVKTTVTLSTKEVKKGIRVTVKVPVDQKADKTGVIIYRSTSKNAKPYAVYKKVATKGSTYIIRNYYNVKGNRLVKGKTYYYKARAYKVIDGKTYYGPMSTIKSIKAK